MRMYVDRKRWDIPEIGVNVNMYSEILGNKITTVIDRDIMLPDGIEPKQRNRLIEIAKKCPISKILENDIKVNLSF